MAKPFGGKRPQDLRHTLRRFMDYLGRHKIMLGVVGLLAAVSALAALLGTYMIRPIVKRRAGKSAVPPIWPVSWR